MVCYIKVNSCVTKYFSRKSDSRRKCDKGRRVGGKVGGKVRGEEGGRKVDLLEQGPGGDAFCR